MVRPRIERMLGHSDFELEWVSIYRFQCRRLERFIHGRVIFAGDAAHQVSPFGARGANSGIQDADNLGWKLAVVASGAGPRDLLASYDSERSEAADENILNSTRATDFIAPRSAAEARFRNAALALAKAAPFARRFVNSGRLSLPTSYRGSPLSTSDHEPWRCGPPPGAPFTDAPMGEGFLSENLGGGFTLLAAPKVALPDLPAVLTMARVSVSDTVIGQRYGLRAEEVYLLRPDGHVAARFHKFDQKRLSAALARAGGMVDAA